ncbi:DUF2249 domain-containing protein [Neorhizobium galegae]|uniref:DUF2249 domain-containing protein n=1 Tax=Neorhizobium galegae TaxID=399 RepID=UPI00062109E3|nr:DUF2249 domain-containing protein [Neorhizobium galegae]KAB1120585.1 DUF2249 domain-containing protein [Neorhizobium galegae]MCQ1810190.1 DUF2249 domain-containing protein [Neorhizobium galegae]CDZ63321.1 Hypothetical protein NGAL_HAMBI2566_55080 [Neorhizobium galegae bv. orientalis]
MSDIEIPSIDVRTLAPAEGHPKISGVLTSLISGGVMHVTSDHDPRPLHYQIESRYPEEFDWQYLEQGPDVWRVEIQRAQSSGCDCCCGH